MMWGSTFDFAVLYFVISYQTRRGHDDFFRVCIAVLGFSQGVIVLYGV